MIDHNDTAQRIVAQVDGRSYKSASTRKTMYEVPGLGAMDAYCLCKDGRVVLALMEKCKDLDIQYYAFDLHHRWSVTARVDVNVRGDSLALAIVLACLDALEGADDDTNP